MVARAHARTAAFAAAAEEPAGVGPYTWRCDLSRALPAFRAGEAEAQYQEAIRLGPRATAGSAYNNLGNFLVNAGRRSEAIDCDSD